MASEEFWFGDNVYSINTEAINTSYCTWSVMCVSSQFLHKHPGHRLGCHPKTGAEDIKAHLFFKSIEWDKLERRELKPPFKPKIVSDTAKYNTI